MRRLRLALHTIWPTRLAAQLIALLLFALVSTQVVSLILLLDERRHALRAAERAQVLARTASIVRLLEATPPELHPHILRTASSPRLRFWVADDHAVESIETNRHDPYSSVWTSCLKATASRCWSNLRTSGAKDGTGGSADATRVIKAMRGCVSTAMALSATPRPPRRGGASVGPSGAT